MKPGSHDFTEQKQRQLSRRRRLIFNNDGGDTVKSPAKELKQPRDFLDIRTTPLKGSHVDTISYCSGIFGACRHNTRIGHLSQTWASNVIPELIQQGTDPLQVMVEYCRENRIEMFWSLRMNDTHDASRPDRFKENPFKTNNPQCLLGTEDNPPLYGGWSAVDYSCSKVRQHALAFIEEVCRNYDVDGIELDFFRHPVFFKSVSQGLPATDEERLQMSELMRNIGAMIESEGQKRGRPFLIAARVPDDIAYANTIGLEIERWMAERLIDIYIPSAYIRLNSWEYSVQLGHKYGVKVYPGLSESRVGGGHHADPLRSSDECYRARALNAWNAGADGVYLFNLFDPHRRIWSEMGDPQLLASLDKVCFASNRGVGKVAGGSYPHQHFIRIPTLNPGAPIALEPNTRETVKIQIGDNPSALPAGQQPAVKLSLRMQPKINNIDEIMVNFNGRRLQGEINEEWLEYDLAADSIRPGENTVELCYQGNRDDLRLEDMMAAFNYSGELLKDKSYMDRTRRNM